MLLLDSCAHPTCNGQWTQGRTGVTHADLAAELLSSGWSGALAIGLPGVGGYDHRLFMDRCEPHPSLVPVAAMTTHQTGRELDVDLDAIEECGYRIVKIHPRLLGYEDTLAALPELVGACVERDLAVALCTYPEYRSTIEPGAARERMATAMAGCPDGHYITMHTGVLDPAPFADLAATNPRVLLDFSLSLTRYPDPVRALVLEVSDRTPRAISLGSDGPEWTYGQVRQALDDVRGDLGPEAMAGFAGENLRVWLEGLHGLPVSGTPK